MLFTLATPLVSIAVSRLVNTQNKNGTTHERDVKYNRNTLVCVAVFCILVCHESTVSRKKVTLSQRFFNMVNLALILVLKAVLVRVWCRSREEYVVTKLNYLRHATRT